MDQRLVIGANWKMNHSTAEARQYIADLRGKLGAIDANLLRIYVLPPFTALEAVVNGLRGFPIETGAQDIFWESYGAFTGEVSPRFIKEIGCTIAMIGHSERRTYFGETDITVAKKVLAACKNGIVPLLCIGEDLNQRRKGETETVLGHQLTVVLEKIQPDLVRKILILYEPRWAIGQAEPASQENIETAHAQIRRIIERRFNPILAQEIRLLYGGSVNRDNLGSILRYKNVDGCGVGRAAWDASEFATLIRIAESAASEKREIY